MSVPTSEIKRIKETYAQAVQDPAIQYLALMALQHRNNMPPTEKNFHKNVASIGFFDKRQKGVKPLGVGVAHSVQDNTSKSRHSERLAMLQALQNAAQFHRQSGTFKGHIPVIPDQISKNNPTNLENSNALINRLTYQGKNYLGNFPIKDAYSERDFCGDEGDLEGCGNFLNDLYNQDGNSSLMVHSLGGNQGRLLRKQVAKANKVAPWDVINLNEILESKQPEYKTNNMPITSFIPSNNNTNNNTNPEVTESILSSLAPQIINTQPASNKKKKKKKNQSAYDYASNNNKANEPED